MKGKVLEAFACKKLVIGSKASFDGIPVENGVNAIMADTPEEYIELIARYILDVPARETVGINAFKLVKDEFDIDIVVNKWKQICK